MYASAISRLDLASVISRFSTSARKKGHSAYSAEPGEPLPGEPEGVERAAAAVPGRKQAPVLGPGEHPRDRPERLSSPVAAASGPRTDGPRSRAGRARDPRESTKETREAGIVPDERPVGRRVRPRRAPPSCPGRPRSAARDPPPPGTPSGRRRDRRLEVPLCESREAVLERDRLSLLGQLQPPSTAPGGWARIPAWVGPPPRPAEPPRP